MGKCFSCFPDPSIGQRAHMQILLQYRCCAEGGNLHSSSPNTSYSGDCQCIWIDLSPGASEFLVMKYINQLVPRGDIGNQRLNA